MLFSSRKTYHKNEGISWPIPNQWDALGIIFVLTMLFLVAWGTKSMSGQFHLGEIMPITLNPTALPYYALRSIMRMFIAMIFSLLFTFVFGTWAAKSKRAERLIIPMIDVLQSVPVLGFLSITVVGFILLFPGSMLGPEAASIFAIFTAQVWNIALSFYQSLKTVPNDLRDASRMFRLSAWQKFWKLEVPFAMPGLLWNVMISMSGSWVFLVASEAITVANQKITLPGVGSYIAEAIIQKNMPAILYVIIAMFIVIAIYDQVIFRPLIAWAEKFKSEEVDSETYPESWVLDLFQQTRLIKMAGVFFTWFSEMFVNGRWFRKKQVRHRFMLDQRWARYSHYLYQAALVIAILAAALFLAKFIFSAVSIAEARHVIYLGFVTAVRVTVIILLSSVIWVPLGVMIGMHRRASQIVQPIAQFLAAFPVNLLFPLVVILILRYKLSVNIWVSPLMILGTQWYILFNVVAGAMALPKNLLEATKTLNVKGWLWWKRLILPGIFPYYITGAITAAGGAWNISIIAEAVSWGHHQLYATGIGAYIAKVSETGDSQKIVLGVVVMSLYVLVINRLLWRPLYHLAEQRFQ